MRSKRWRGAVALAGCLLGGAGLAQPRRMQPEPGPPPKVANQGTPALDEELGLVPPTAAALFRAESESEFLRGLRDEAARNGIKASFPKDAAVPPAPVPGVERCWPGSLAMTPAGKVCHRPLYFEDPMAERYGWYIPYLQPAISSGRFWLDALLLPGWMVVQPPWSWQCDPAEPAPGDQVPFQCRFGL
jgi:hypothetical protein